MTLEERLKLELEQTEAAPEEKDSKFGTKEISYSVNDRSIPNKFQKLREKNEKHMKERKNLIRTAKKLKGRRKLDSL